MATVNGAMALGLNPEWFGLRETPGRIAGLVGVGRGNANDPLHGMLSCASSVEVLLRRQ
jgi:hypothetical protein